MNDRVSDIGSSEPVYFSSNCNAVFLGKIIIFMGYWWTKSKFYYFISKWGHKAVFKSFMIFFNVLSNFDADNFLD